MAYAEDTSVPVERSRAEIERMVARRGAVNFASGWMPNRAVIGFAMQGRVLRFELPMPSRDAREFTHTPSTKKLRPASQAHAAWEQGCRRAWRALALCIKAKFEAVESGIVAFEDEFLPHFVVQTEDGPRLFADVARPFVQRAYSEGHMPPLLGMGEHQESERRAAAKEET